MEHLNRYLLLVICVCHSTQGIGVFRNGTAVAVINSNQIDQTSGICPGGSHPGYLYTHNDHGDGSHIYVLDSKTGHRISTITIRGAHNADWEDIACGPCPGGGHCIYIASGIEVHPKITHVPLTGWNSHATIVLKDLVNLNIPLTGMDPTGGDISPNGKEALIITHNAMYHFEIPDGMVVLALSASNPINVPYIQEPKGEAVSCDKHGNGYFTLGEGHDQTLYYYGRNTDIVG
ncbi:uncharacterized protein LOC134689994 [Mytilus trossulus]|uniref:uncharacterized protein LOC134689994 n=1 Tax=Mytilus trossulus TaxID=6551 RepID=UPI003007F1F8